MNIQPPRRVILELTNKCNLRCIMCAQNFVAFDNTSLPLSLIRKLEIFLKRADEVTLFGYGEPLLNNEFRQILAFLAQYQSLRTYLLTNGVLLPKFVDGIIDNRLTYLSISIDAAVPETFQAIRRGGKMVNIVEALKRIKDLKKERNTQAPYLRFVFVAMKQNIQELPALVKLAHELDVSEIKVEYLVAHSPDMVPQSLFFHRDLLSWFKKAAQQAESMRVKLTLPPLIGEDEAGDVSHKECTTPFDTLFVSSNGDIRACMISTEVFGNIAVDTAESIWSGPGISLFRKRVNSTEPPRDCKTCWQASHLNVNRQEAHVKLNVTIGRHKSI
jgi:radical SAM protein with 4Fe4S-binding SPASM domain